jgi:hypothetical protein
MEVQKMQVQYNIRRNHGAKAREDERLMHQAIFKSFFV